MIASRMVTATRMGREKSSGLRSADLQVRSCGSPRRGDERTWRSALPGSDFEDPRILALDLVGHLLDLGRILAQRLDRGERRTAGLGLDLLVGRVLAAQIDDELLALGRHDPGEHQARGIGIGRGLEHRHRVGYERGALDRMHDLDRRAALPGYPEQIVAAIDRDGAFAGLDLLARL